MITQPKARPLFDPSIVRRAIGDSFKKLDPRHQVKKPVMFVVEVSSVLTTVLAIQALFGQGEAPAGFIIAISLWLWFTVVFANFAEAMAEGRGKAQADTLRKARKDVHAKKLTKDERRKTKDGGVDDVSLRPSSFVLRPHEIVPASELKKEDVVLIEAGDFVPGDGEVLEGVASVDESAITGESAPVIRESGGDRSAVT